MGALDRSRETHSSTLLSDTIHLFELDSPLGHPFYYGSHYSTEGFVIYYMLRQEPFTTLGVNLQGGRFDCPDRLFFNAARTYDGCCRQSVSAVKELIREFFTTPEIFLSKNKLSLDDFK